MASFLYHTSCSECGSSDAKAIYDDASSYCFSCRNYKPGKLSNYVLQKQADGSLPVLPENIQHYPLPGDACKDYSQGALEWVGKYGITTKDLIACKNQIYFSPSRNQLIFSFPDESGNTLAWQARNLGNVDKKKRYFSKGDLNNLLPIYSSKEPDKSLVLVEDCISALKCSLLGASAMPLLGSDINNTKLSRLRPFYDVLKVFLDPDMFHHAVLINRRASLLGFQVSVIKADRDPKEFSWEELKDLLTSH